jgi:hypothetical protein
MKGNRILYKNNSFNQYKKKILTNQLIIIMFHLINNTIAMEKIPIKKTCNIFNFNNKTFN